MRTWVYIDGFNLYYGAVKGTPFKWLNLVELGRQVLPAGHVIDRVKYFTARVSGAIDPGSPARQQQYLSALSTLPQVEVHYGTFLAKTIWRPIINLPIAGKPLGTMPPTTLPPGNHSVAGNPPGLLPVGSYPQRGSHRKRKRKKTPRPLPNATIAEVHTMEEKGSDVNLAAHLLNDAWKNAFDVAAVISNDTDLIEPIRMVTIERQKPVHIVCPGRWPVAPKLKAVATHVRHIHRSMLQAAQLPSPLPGTTISKPTSW